MTNIASMNIYDDYIGFEKAIYGHSYIDTRLLEYDFTSDYRDLIEYQNLGVQILSTLEEILE